MNKKPEEQLIERKLWTYMDDFIASYSRKEFAELIGKMRLIVMRLQGRVPPSYVSD